MGRKIQTWKDWAPVVMARYWVAQGMGYMNWTERVHRLVVETVFVVIAWWPLGLILSGWERLVVALLAGHTANMVLNGHPFALFKHDLFWFGFYRTLPDFLAYVEGIQRRLCSRRPAGLARAEIYGSLTKGEFSDTSDLDLRYIALPGFLSGMRVAQAVFLERLRAVLRGFPLDLYMFQSEDELRAKMNVAVERPVVLYRAEWTDKAPSVGELIGQLCQTRRQSQGTGQEQPASVNS